MIENTQPAVTLEMVLAAKDRRAAVQTEMRNDYGAVVISMTLNMPGPVKYKPAWLGMLYDAAEALRKRCSGYGIRIFEERMLHDTAGATLFVAASPSPEVSVPTSAPASEAATRLKKVAVELEDNKPWGRLLDLDVFSETGEQINRTSLGLPPRKCLVCEDVAALCVRAMRHDRNEVIAAAMRLADTYAKKRPLTPSEASIARRIGQTALEAMLMEVAATPSPGLVDRFNSGAHDDMDISTFIRSSSALAGPMTMLVEEGLRHEGTLPELLPKIRRIGIDAEHEMFQATYGINTQKGLLFLLGILAAAAGYALKPLAECSADGLGFKTEAIAKCAAGICEGLVSRELESLRHHKPDRQLTAGEHYYIAHGFTGVRGEIEHGLPTVMRVGLPALEAALAEGATDNDALVHALIALMTRTEDTTILHRHDLEVLKAVQAEAAALFEAGGYLTAEGKQQVAEMDQRFIQNHISPGGSADLLAVTWFLYRLKDFFGFEGV
ncbi:triphosphoribosyl-dephospho-CoA synthase CitG [Acidaminobacter hydrogenoformans]|uniref:Probable 2-(5''-triphosphoribosyl)-3'-dephosphocoenzyme-A synthase n=1 Tax=Acidaminobacter hydrogenoformans DSM 2784 TaxID=1120920 RepID=A0A1G5RZV7_9FIRM|nr:triphosphoribosyl-dephospho-CoA synthase CitG [Acidaminobacter hydrogenoformans]SCZ79398.1 holo-ACP synthase / triphosphoribosyl-dephospho-CoA synthase [Acidaminobacter hydrogenoformans DSM 2784]